MSYCADFLGVKCRYIGNTRKCHDIVDLQVTVENWEASEPTGSTRILPTSSDPTPSRRSAGRAV